MVDFSIPNYAWREPREGYQNPPAFDPSTAPRLSELLPARTGPQQPAPGMPTMRMAAQQISDPQADVGYLSQRMAPFERPGAAGVAMPAPGDPAYKPFYYSNLPGLAAQAPPRVETDAEKNPAIAYTPMRPAYANAPDPSQQVSYRQLRSIAQSQALMNAHPRTQKDQLIGVLGNNLLKQLNATNDPNQRASINKQLTALVNPPALGANGVWNPAAAAGGMPYLDPDASSYQDYGTAY